MAMTMRRAAMASARMMLVGVQAGVTLRRDA
jgi:hypothetical protein